MGTTLIATRVSIRITAALALLALLLPGCAAGSGPAPARTVSLAEFAPPTAKPAESRAKADAAETETGESTPGDDVLEIADPGPAPIELYAEGEADPQPGGQPPIDLGDAPQPSGPDAASGNTRQRPARPSRPAGNQRVVVDSLVGEINGRPIYASEFFQPIEDHILAISRQVSSEREFRQATSEVIARYLEQIVENELFLAEAEADLTQDEQRGLIAWMRQMREEEVARGGGTRTGAHQRIMEAEGMSLDEYLSARRDFALMQRLFYQRIKPRVIVTERDIDREYRRRWDEFNPPATIRIARISVPTAQQEQVESVQQRLDAGENFHAVADDLGMRDGGEWMSFQMGAGGIEDIELADNVKQHLIGLGVGETTQPFTVGPGGRSTWWLHISDIEQAEGRSRYDPEVQRMLRNMIEQRRMEEEQMRYRDKLIDDDIRAELNRMHRRLEEIAVRRYGPSR